MFLEQIFRIVMGAKQRFDFTAKRLVRAAGLRKKLSAHGDRLFEGRHENFLNLFPFLRLH